MLKAKIIWVTGTTLKLAVLYQETKSLDNEMLCSIAAVYFCSVTGNLLVDQEQDWSVTNTRCLLFIYYLFCCVCLVILRYYFNTKVTIPNNINNLFLLQSESIMKALLVNTSFEQKFILILSTGWDDEIFPTDFFCIFLQLIVFKMMPSEAKTFRHTAKCKLNDADKFTQVGDHIVLFKKIKIFCWVFTTSPL